MAKSQKAIEYAVALQYAKTKVRKLHEPAVARGERPLSGLTLHNMARKHVTPSLLALARINLTRGAKRFANEAERAAAQNGVTS